MLTSLNIENYRCFKQHSISFHKTTFLVGENNAGKSTIIEALRFVGLAQRRYKTANYVSAPDWLDEEFGGMNCMRMQLNVLDLPPPLAHFLTNMMARLQRFQPSSQTIHVLKSTSAKITIRT